MKFMLSVILAFLVFCWVTCLVYMMANDTKKQLPNNLVEYKNKWFYLVLFLVLTALIVGLFYVMFISGGVL